MTAPRPFSSIRRSSSASTGSRLRAAATSLSRRPSASRRASVATSMMFSHPTRRAMLSVLVVVSASRMRARPPGSWRRLSISATPPSRAQSGNSVRSDVLDAVYGYASARTSSPSARAASMSCSASATLPQFGRPAAFRWLICTGISASRPTVIASFTAWSSVAPSPRM